MRFFIYVELMIRGTDTMCREYRPPVSYPRPIHDPLQLFHGLSVDLCGANVKQIQLWSRFGGMVREPTASSDE